MDDLTRAIEAAHIGGAVLLKHFKTPDIRVKNVKDLVTNADIESEEAIRDFLLSNSDDGFFGEETEPVRGKRVWIVDPLDGTWPFSFGVPHFSVSVALCDRTGVLAGAVFDPVMNITYSAQRGRGAFANNEPLHRTTERPIDQALVSCAFQFSRPELQNLTAAIHYCQLIYSAALDVCQVAAGRIDAAVYGLTSCYDHAAAALIAQEAGVTVTNFGSETWDPYVSGIIAATPKLHAKISALFPTPLQELDDVERCYQPRMPTFID